MRIPVYLLAFLLYIAALVGCGYQELGSFAKPSDEDIREKMREDLVSCGSTSVEVACVVQGRDKWLFLQESLIYSYVPWKDNSASFFAFNDSLKKMGITLVVAPVPDKLQVGFSHYMPGIAYHEPYAYKAWVEKLRSGGVLVVDASEAFRQRDKRKPVFEPYESHCTFEGRHVMAKEISRSIAGVVGDLPKSEYSLRPLLARGTGNLYHLLYGNYKWYWLPMGAVFSADGEKFKGSKDAPIVVIGDSNAKYGDNAASDVGSLITLETGVETFNISKIGGGNSGAKFFKGRRSFLKGKRVLVWLFDGRELYGNFAMPEL